MDPQSFYWVCYQIKKMLKKKKSSGSVKQPHLKLDVSLTGVDIACAGVPVEQKTKMKIGQQCFTLH